MLFFYFKFIYSKLIELKNPWSPLFRLTNVFGNIGTSLGMPFAQLDAGRFINKAKKQTGLHNFGEDLFGENDEFYEGIERLVESAKKEAKLTPLGELAIQQDIIRLLTNRLKLVGDRINNPGIAGQQILQPIIIASFPRTGTTFLHGIMEQDQRMRVPKSWEVMYPSPPPDENVINDQRVSKVNNQLTWFFRMAPQYKVAHPLGAELAQECMEITSHTFKSERFYRTYHVPEYVDWVDGGSLKGACAFHKAFLQHLQWKSQAGWWVLKNPPHIFAINELSDTYPDARFIQTHRDPITVISSFMSHTRRLRKAFSNQPDLYSKEKTIERWSEGISRLMKFRENHPESTWIDIHYHELLERPIETIEKIYSALAIDLSDKTLDKMKKFVKDHPQYAYGVHKYAPKDFGIDPDMRNPVFDQYVEIFKVKKDKY